jgi:hypothetical protein
MGQAKHMSIYDADKHCWSGLFSENNHRYQKGLRQVCRNIGDMQFHPTGSGYGGYQDVIKSAIRRKPPALLLMGHSNGNIATTRVAKALEPHGITCWLICWDRTMGRCESLRSNVPEALDMWAGPPMRKLQLHGSFDGTYVLKRFLPEGHISILGNKEAQKLATDFGKRFNERYSL